MATTSRRTNFALAIAVAWALVVMTFVAGPVAEAAPPAHANNGAGWEDATFLKNVKSTDHAGSMYYVTNQITKAASFWGEGVTGSGIGVALIDSGVAPVEGLTIPGKVVNGPDLSFESQNDAFRYLDTFGHGTHLAGIIAGRDSGAKDVRSNDKNSFLGMAPDARLISVKVAPHDGAVDVSQVIAAIDWVVQHRNDAGMNIKVLALAYGTDSTQSWQVDPLSYAIEQAWKAGIVVVVAAGNDGNAVGLRNPGTNPNVITVGASDGAETLTPFSNCGTSARPVDLVAPGKSIVSLRAPGSEIDLNNPKAVVENRLFLGSGTSQAAAVVAGAAALVVDQRPDITPDQVKALLTETAAPLVGVATTCQGAGVIDLGAARKASTPKTSPAGTSASGQGSLEAARGSSHIELDGVVLQGEQDIFGQPWDPATWAKTSASYSSWEGGTWNGSQWSGLSWGGLSWSGLSWSGLSWSGLSWSGLSWSGLSWSGLSWSGLSWSGLSWSGLSWSSA